MRNNTQSFNVYASDNADAFTVVPLLGDTECWGNAYTVASLADVPASSNFVF